MPVKTGARDADLFLIHLNERLPTSRILDHDGA
jgi:hypothetical protein